MSHHPRSILLKSVLAGCLASLVYLGVLRPFSIVEIPKLKVQDLFLAGRKLVLPSPSIAKDFVVVTVDDESIEKLREKQPFPRRVYAQAIEKIMAWNPKAIALDMIFSGTSNPTEDFLLTEAISKSGKVVLASFIDSEKNYVLPHPDFREVARGSGIVNKLLDQDLGVRKASLFYRDPKGNVVGWPWEAEILFEVYGISRTQFQVTGRGVQLGEPESQKSIFIPFYEGKETMINYRFELKDIDHIPLWRVIQDGNDLKNRFQGKIVLVGAVSRILHDYYHTPLGLMPGVIVNLNLLANFLAQDFLKKLPLAMDALILFMIVLFASYLAFRENVLRGLIYMIVGTGFLKLGFFGLLLKNYLADFFTPLVSGWLAYTGVIFYRYFHTLLENVQLRGKVITDPLTGLYNRRALESQIDIELEKIASGKGARKTDLLHEVSILMIDIDNFKQINDTYGHQVGDDVLKNISFSIKDNIRKVDLAARFGGEEFCAVLPHTTKQEAYQIAEKIRATIESRKFSYVNKMASFTVSVGVASAKEDNLLSSRNLIRGADQALYEAKRTGKNKVCLYQERS